MLRRATAGSTAHSVPRYWRCGYERFRRLRRTLVMHGAVEASPRPGRGRPRVIRGARVSLPPLRPQHVCLLGVPSDGHDARLAARLRRSPAGLRYGLSRPRSDARPAREARRVAVTRLVHRDLGGLPETASTILAASGWPLASIRSLLIHVRNDCASKAPVRHSLNARVANGRKLLRCLPLSLSVVGPPYASSIEYSTRLDSMSRNSFSERARIA